MTLDILKTKEELRDLIDDYAYGQHTVKIDGDMATGVSFTQIKMIREIEGKDVLTDYCVKYDDKYVHQNGKWLIKDRIGYFIMIEERALNS